MKTTVVNSTKKPRAQRLAGPPDACAMGKIYRFIEPALLLLLAEQGDAYGYRLREQMLECALTKSTVERAALYRTLRTLESNGFVKSRWDASGTTPARRIYRLTRAGRKHLKEWSALLSELGASMTEFANREEKT
jgi:PadR family transcriptional regulator, regulatory protein PadR